MLLHRRLSVSSRQRSLLTPRRSLLRSRVLSLLMLLHRRLSVTRPLRLWRRPTRTSPPTPTRCAPSPSRLAPTSRPPTRRPSLLLRRRRSAPTVPSRTSLLRTLLARRRLASSWRTSSLLLLLPPRRSSVTHTLTSLTTVLRLRRLWPPLSRASTTPSPSRLLSLTPASRRLSRTSQLLASRLLTRWPTSASSSLLSSLSPAR